MTDPTTPGAAPAMTEHDYEAAARSSPAFALLARLGDTRDPDTAIFAACAAFEAADRAYEAAVEKASEWVPGRGPDPYDLQNRAAEEMKARATELAELQPGTLAAHAARAADPAPDPDAALIADCAEFDELERAFIMANYGGADRAKAKAAEKAQAAIVKRQKPILARIVKARATTMAGLAARGRSAALWNLELMKEGRTGSTDQVLVAAILRDLGVEAPDAAAIRERAA